MSLSNRRESTQLNWTLHVRYLEIEGKMGAAWIKDPSRGKGGKDGEMDGLMSDDPQMPERDGTVDTITGGAYRPGSWR
jgi:hypothetical protein